MPEKNESAGRFGGPGSSHQDREHPGENQQETGHKGGGDRVDAAPGAGKPTNAAFPEMAVSGIGITGIRLNVRSGM